MSYSPLCFLMIRGNIPANSFPKKAVVGCGWPNCAATGLVLGSRAELWQGTPLGLAASPPVVLSRCRAVQGMEERWLKLWMRYHTEILVELETIIHFKSGVELHDPCGTVTAQGIHSCKWVMSDWKKSLALLLLQKFRQSSEVQHCFSSMLSVAIVICVPGHGVKAQFSVSQPGCFVSA